MGGSARKKSQSLMTKLITQNRKKWDGELGKGEGGETLGCKNKNK